MSSIPTPNPLGIRPRAGGRRHKPGTAARLHTRRAAGPVERALVFAIAAGAPIYLAFRGVEWGELLRQMGAARLDMVALEFVGFSCSYFLRSVRYGLGTLAVIGEFWFNRLRLRRSSLFPEGPLPVARTGGAAAAGR